MSSKLIIGLLCCVLINFSLGKNLKLEKLSIAVQTSLHQIVINPLSPHLVFDNQIKADAWLDDMRNRLKVFIADQFLSTHYLTIIQYEASRAALDPQIILSLITQESKFNQYAIGSSGEKGLMQIMPFWLSSIGDLKQDLFDVQTNVRFGCTILRFYLQQEHGDIMRALARYNGSLGTDKYTNAVMEKYQLYWQPALYISIKNGEIRYIDYTN